MSRRLSVTVETFELGADFVISRGSKRQAVVVVATIGADTGVAGRGECVPYQRYGESVDGVVAAIEGIRAEIEAGLSRTDLQRILPAGAARNAIDCALWDLQAKSGGVSVAALVCRRAPVPLETAYTISLGSPADMAEAARAAAGRGLLKIKLGGAGDIERIRAIAAATRGARLILDANEAWTAETLRENLLAAAAAGAILVEQPLPAGDDGALATLPHPVPVCADESLHRSGDLPGLVGRYDYVNVKLDKTGGLTEALHLVGEARRLGFGVMVGCMVSSSLAMAPAVLLAQDADLVDLDGPLLMKADRRDGLVYSAATVAPPTPALWG